MFAVFESKVARKRRNIREADRIGIVGIGKIARDQHIPSILADGHFTFAAAASRHSEARNVDNFQTIEAMLETRPDLDAVAICTPPQQHYAAAKLALEKGKHVLLEKPPCTSALQLENLVRLAKEADRTLYQTWHSQHAHGVAPTARLLKKRDPRSIRVTWKEDVRQWHPGQTWIWQAGGFGVFDPGINALSILTKIIPDAIFPRSAILYVPSNCDAPIAADLELVTDTRRADFGGARFSPDRRRRPGTSTSRPTRDRSNYRPAAAS